MRPPYIQLYYSLFLELYIIDRKEKLKLKQKPVQSRNLIRFSDPPSSFVGQRQAHKFSVPYSSNKPESHILLEKLADAKAYPKARDIPSIDQNCQLHFCLFPSTPFSHILVLRNEMVRLMSCSTRHFPALFPPPLLLFLYPLTFWIQEFYGELLD